MSRGEGRTPHGVRELKLHGVFEDAIEVRRTPHGVRELKQIRVIDQTITRESHPSRGA